MEEENSAATILKLARKQEAKKAKKAKKEKKKKGNARV
jgi:hypothetical protein